MKLNRFYAYLIQPKDVSDRLSKPFRIDLSIAILLIFLLIGLSCSFMSDAVPNRSAFRKLHEGCLWAIATLSQQGS